MLNFHLAPDGVLVVMVVTKDEAGIVEVVVNIQIASGILATQNVLNANCVTSSDMLSSASIGLTETLLKEDAKNRIRMAKILPPPPLSTMLFRKLLKQLWMMLGILIVGPLVM